VREGRSFLSDAIAAFGEELERCALLSIPYIVTHPGAHTAAMASLRKAHGQNFDRVFLRQEVDFHNAVIDAVTTTLLPAIQNAQLKDLVTKVAPAFVAHRDRAQSLLKEIK